MYLKYVKHACGCHCFKSNVNMTYVCVTVPNHVFHNGKNF